MYTRQRIKEESMEAEADAMEGGAWWIDRGIDISDTGVVILSEGSPHLRPCGSHDLVIPSGESCDRVAIEVVGEGKMHVSSCRP